MVLACCLSGGCATQSTDAGYSSTVSAATGASSKASCSHVVVALDPGHNPVRVDGFDPVTGASQIDYPNGAEDANVFEVATEVRELLQHNGYDVVMLKHAVTENVTYRQRVDRAVAAHARVAISIHTSPGANDVFVQRVGLYREGVGADGATLRITYRNEATAAASQRFGEAIARARTRAEGNAGHVDRQRLWGSRAAMDRQHPDDRADVRPCALGLQRVRTRRRRWVDAPAIELARQVRAGHRLRRADRASRGRAGVCGVSRCDQQGLGSPILTADNTASPSVTGAPADGVCATTIQLLSTTCLRP